MTSALVFCLSFCQNYLATREVSAIAERRSARAAAWAALSSSLSFCVMVAVIVHMDRWALLVPYVLGDVAATFIAIKYQKR